MKFMAPLKKTFVEDIEVLLDFMNPCELARFDDKHLLKRSIYGFMKDKLAPTPALSSPPITSVIAKPFKFILASSKKIASWFGVTCEDCPSDSIWGCYVTKSCWKVVLVAIGAVFFFIAIVMSLFFLGQIDDILKYQKQLAEYEKSYPTLAKLMIKPLKSMHKAIIKSHDNTIRSLTRQCGQKSWFQFVILWPCTCLKGTWKVFQMALQPSCHFFWGLSSQFKRFIRDTGLPDFCLKKTGLRADPIGDAKRKKKLDKQMKEDAKKAKLDEKAAKKQAKIDAKEEKKKQKEDAMQAKLDSLEEKKEAEQEAKEAALEDKLESKDPTSLPLSPPPPPPSPALPIGTLPLENSQATTSPLYNQYPYGPAMQRYNANPYGVNSQQYVKYPLGANTPLVGQIQEQGYGVYDNVVTPTEQPGIYSNNLIYTQQGGYVQAQQQGGYGQANQQGDYGQAQQGGYGQTQLQGGYGQAQQQGGYGEAQYNYDPNIINAQQNYNPGYY